MLPLPAHLLSCLGALPAVLEHAHVNVAAHGVCAACSSSDENAACAHVGVQHQAAAAGLQQGKGQGRVLGMLLLPPLLLCTQVYPCVYLSVSVLCELQHIP
jgi:hypothetical protein